MSLPANALATFADATSLFGYLDDEQTKVETLIGIASSRMDAFCRRALAARDWTLILDGTGTDTLLVPHYPINSVSKIYVDARSFGADSEVASGYGIESEDGILVLYSGSFSAKGLRDTVKIVYNGGYEQHLQHPVLKAACLEYVDWLKSRYSRPGAIGRKGEYSADRVSVSFETEMPMHIRAMLEEFRRVVA